VRLGLRILSGAHPRDPWSLDVPFDGAAPVGPIRVALVAAPPGEATDPVVTAATRAAADSLANAGYDVVETCPPRYAEAVEVWSRLITWDFEAGMDLMVQLMGPGGRAFLQATRESTGKAPNAPALSALLGQRDAIARDWSLFMADHPLLLTPTWTQLPFEHGWDADSPANALGTLSLMRPVTHANLLGLPSACVPAAYDKASGLPIGVLITGRRMRDDQCLDAAEAIEARFSLSTPIDPVW
jgi:amidase